MDDGYCSRCDTALIEHGRDANNMPVCDSEDVREHELDVSFRRANSRRWSWDEIKRPETE